LDGFGHVGVHSRGEATLAIIFKGMSGEGDDGGSPAREFLALADFGGGFEAVHLRHLNVHQDEIEFRVLRCGIRLLAIDGNGDRESAFLEQALRQGAIDGVVFHQ
jgi:hypothetical protein